jgi:hypothetical protein
MTILKLNEQSKKTAYDCLEITLEEEAGKTGLRIPRRKT